MLHLYRNNHIVYNYDITTGKSKGQHLTGYLPKKFSVNLEKQNF